ncbi:hypothetical protein [Actinocrispum wychmicini]|uniref:Uncharacterized protein n=1 Tax=Actinocrispum wychmicini TaxID=1213861 RepID=A0A4R2JXP9_9PSEU|nr:hypothetical protein [Actinocrispum wychmicini]TCO64654.1 hypothetical protein EV192_101434 [Actinocrispum wychmicini]
MKEPGLGVDFGRVINEGSAEPGGDDTTFLSGGYEEAMRTPAMPDAMDVLPRLVEMFEGRVWIVSKCGPRIQERTLQWLDHHDFWNKTGILRANTRFCRERAEKAVHCKRLGITHFIDDRRDVLGHMRDVVEHRYLFGPQKTPAPDWVVATPTWADVQSLISLSSSRTRAMTTSVTSPKSSRSTGRSR